MLFACRSWHCQTRCKAPHTSSCAWAFAPASSSSCTTSDCPAPAACSRGYCQTSLQAGMIEHEQVLYEICVQPAHHSFRLCVVSLKQVVTGMQGTWVSPRAMLSAHHSSPPAQHTHLGIRCTAWFFRMLTEHAEPRATSGIAYFDSLTSVEPSPGNSAFGSAITLKTLCSPRGAKLSTCRIQHSWCAPQTGRPFTPSQA